MKKIVLLSGIIMTILVSCSTEETPNYNQNTTKTIQTKEDQNSIYITYRDSISRENDSIVSEPIKPKKD